jgi:hypothetical protein
MMSRAYRIKVRESLNRTLRAQDSVSTQLEILEILPREQMAGLLAAELEAAGYRRDGKQLVRNHDGIVITVDSNSGEVVVRAEACSEVRLEKEKEERAFDDVGPNARAVRERVRRDVQGALEKSANDKQAELQSKVTDQLEGQLIDLSRELDGAVNRATAAALKIKAAQLGQIKEILEDNEAGSLTIVLEV